ncbi:DUF2254 domain-containing protein [Paracoccus sp. SCSIO 75233]|uniref:DUF2254 domain-containing protein n=1 Tax=Paracoccus sp. SCSIO 75233 TaxID=3017782 RepID=UPI0022F027B2|nr:DUF2254 domain-containing protein [Paracoccus sp. SCSIO 75233]WBU52459.1 DUF2254 domain-containing protein [Paracoccus sp. SCSIO 75233]
MSWSKFSFRLRELLGQVWLRVLVFAVMGIVTAIAALLLRPFIPDSLTDWLGADAVGSVLEIIATSMLSVTIFALSTLVSAWAAAEQNSSPRVLPLIVSDGRSQTVLSTFIGAFVFSLVGIIMLRTGVYGGSGRVVVFAATVVVVLLIIGTLLQWIEVLSDLGQIRDSLDRLEEATTRAIRNRQKEPYLGGRLWVGDPPAGAEAIFGDKVGRVRHVDVSTLSQLAEEFELTLYLDGIPGTLVHAARPLLFVTGLDQDDEEKRKPILNSLNNAFTIGQAPSFEQDPLHGITALSEVAQRALSPGINDPGTAQDVIVRLVRVLSDTGAVAEDHEIERQRLFVREITADDMMQAAFAPIIRDSADVYEVQISLLDGLRALSKLQPQFYAESAGKLAAFILHYVERSEMPQPQVEKIRDLSGNLVSD